MRFRVTLALVALLAVALGYLYFFELRKSPVSQPLPPQFYETDEDLIERISINYLGKAITFARDSQDYWHFDSPEGTPVDIERWGGVTLLLGGPRSRRLLTQEARDLSPYGLDRPPISVTISLRGGSQFGILLGNKTPDGAAHYSVMKGYENMVFLIDSSWGDVLSRLVTEPPYPPTPTPEASQG